MDKSNKAGDSQLSDEEEILLKSAQAASSKARRSSKALGLVVKMIKGNKILSVDPSKGTTVLRTLERVSFDIGKVKKGMVLHRK